MIKYTIACPNCGKTKTFEKKQPNSYERKFCSQSCTNEAIWTPEKRKIASEQSKIVAARRDMAEVAKARWDKPGAHAKHSQAIKDKWANPDYYKMMCKKRQIACNDPNYLAQKSEVMLKLWQDPEYRKKQQGSRQRAWQSPKRRKQQSVRALNYWNDPRARSRQSELMLSYWQDPDYQAKMGITRQDPEVRASISRKIKKLWQDPEYYKNQCRAMRAVWEDPEYYEEQCKERQQRWEDPKYQQAWARGINLRPTKPELELFRLLSLSGYKYIYIGDGSLWIGTKNPDFIWPEQQKLIEMYGSYWHDESEIEPRAQYFADYDFETLFVWDYELDDTEQLLIKLEEFHPGIKLIE